MSSEEKAYIFLYSIYLMYFTLNEHLHDKPVITVILCGT